MKKITIFIFNNALSSTITGPMDVFNSTGIMWNYIMNKKLNPCFNVKLASLDGQPVNCFSNYSIQPHISIDDVENTDLILIPAIVDSIFSTLKNHKDLLPWLKYHNKKNVAIASVCTGAFFLAEAGLLNNRKATTHWAYAALLKRHYPKVNLDTHPLITRDGNIICAAGSSSWSELCLYLVQAFYGNQIAMECSKSLLLDMSRSTQAPYGVLTISNNHQDMEIQSIQDWLHGNYGEKISIKGLANKFKMSERTFKRRFKKATGDSPLAYLQMLRIEAAKGLLEHEELTIEKIALKTGYEDTSFFRKLFKRHTGISPNEYKKSFSGITRINVNDKKSAAIL